MGDSLADDEAWLDRLERRQRLQRHRTKRRPTRPANGTPRQAGPIHGPPVPAWHVEQVRRQRISQAQQGQRNAARTETQQAQECDDVLGVLQLLAERQGVGRTTV